LQAWPRCQKGKRTGSEAGGFANAVFLVFAVFLEDEALAADLLTDFIGFVGLGGVGLGGGELLAEKDFAFGDFGLEASVNFGELLFLGGGEFAGGVGVGGLEAFEGEFVGAFHERQVRGERGKVKARKAAAIGKRGFRRGGR